MANDTQKTPCAPCQKNNRQQHKIQQEQIKHPQKISLSLTGLAQIAKTTIFGGDVEQGIKRAKVCVDCPHSVSFEEIKKLKNANGEQKFTDLELKGAKTIADNLHSDAKKVIESVPEIKPLHCKFCACSIAGKVLSEVEVKREGNKVTNNEEIKNTGCPLNLWYFHIDEEKY